MDIKISDELNGIISYAREEAMRTGSYGIGADHLFLGIIRHDDNRAATVLKGVDVDVEALKKFIDSRIFTNERIPFSELDNITFSREAQNILSLTIIEATKLKEPEVSSNHLLLVLCRTTGSYGYAFLRSIGIGYGQLFKFMEKNEFLGSVPRSNSDSEEENSEIDDEIMLSDKKTKEIPEEFGYDLTKAAAEGKLDPVVGRETEISRVIEILGRRKKNNPILIGEPGVGKSAIVEGIALRIASGEISPVIAKKKIISLDIAAVVAGTKYRGDFEKRLKNIISTASNDPDLILFIDEFHTIVGAGGAQGSLDAANMLKPALARGEIQCIGATTMDEFRKIIEKDGALDRRFQKIVIESTNIEQSISILSKLKNNYEEFHNVNYTADAIESCVRLTDRYIADKSLPDKAIDAMDEAGSMVRIKTGGKQFQATVTEDDIATVVSKMTGIPVNRIAEPEGSRIIKMRAELRTRIIGQDDAVDMVVNAIQRNRAGLKDPGRPIGSFLFFGPTGVGKTKLAKCLAEYLFDSEENIVRIDMSEYMEKFSVSKLIGAPPGYVGYEDGGRLSERVKRKPYCVVLLDEIEKAHPDIFNLLLQVLDDGMLTDSEGYTVSFRNTILIMTSNVGSRELEEYGNGIGFSTSIANVNKNRRIILEKAVKKVFPPEFINRIDEQILFNSLTKDDIEHIIDIELKGIKQRAEESGYKLNITPTAKKFIAEAGFDPAFGARPLKRAIMKYVEDPVSEFIITDRVLNRKKSSPGLRQLKVSLDKESTKVTLKTKENVLAFD
ncbi:MAG: ATP-dependent Clp protease ATP-binding subunit [Candidatus Cryptobacteroides sp.]